MRFRLLILLLLGCGSPQTEPTTIPRPRPTASVVKQDPPEKKAPSLAKSTCTEPAPSGGLDVVVTTKEIRVKGQRVAPDKKDGDLLIVALADIASKSHESEAIVSMAPDVTYRTTIAVLYTLSQSEISTYHLLVTGPSGTASIDIETTRKSVSSRADVVSGSSRRRAMLSLIVLVDPDGISVHGSGANLKPGCNGAGAGLAIPKRDFDALTACVARAKSASPAFAGEDTATISANPDTDFQTVVQTIDAIRPSFPKVELAIAH